MVEESSASSFARYRGHPVDVQVGALPIVFVSVDSVMIIPSRRPETSSNDDPTVSYESVMSGNECLLEWLTKIVR